MKKSIRLLLCAVILALTPLLCVLTLNTTASAATDEVPAIVDLEGQGTKADPYLIQDYEDLCIFRDYVNSGISFAGQYIKQCANIDMAGKSWKPIGAQRVAFEGIYDGAGHYVENLLVEDREYVVDYNGFFGTLGGVVANLGIESGTIYGDFCGSIASECMGTNAAILNCYSKADVYGTRAGGIVDRFNGNDVVCCWFDGTTNGTTDNATDGLISYGGDVKVYHTYTTYDHMVTAEDVHSPTSEKLSKNQLYSEWFASHLSLAVGMAQYLFGVRHDVQLLQWELDANNAVVFSDSTGCFALFGFLNYYFLPLLLVLIMLAYVLAFKKAGKENLWSRYHQHIEAIALISIILAVFVDTAFIKKGLGVLNPGNALFTLLIHILAVWFSALVIRHKRFRFKTEWIPLVIAISVISILELFQFDLIPKYDAGIYYGSLYKAVDLFQVDLLTYIGAFACWKWIHGLVLLIGPLEFLMHGQIIGVYMANMVINAVTMCCMYGILRRLSHRITPVLATLGSLILILCPYQLGLFTYLSMDPHAALFAAWLLYAYLCKNTLLVSFCGYLLCFNKISGMVFYVFFLLTMGVFEVLETEGKNLFRKILNWWRWKKVLLWVFPAVAFLATMVLGDHLTIQVFYGTYTGAGYGFKTLQQLMITLMQSFVYGFRWLFVLVILAAFVMLCFRYKQVQDVTTRKGIAILVATFLGCAAVVLVLCMYQSDADCPRYTELMNIFFAVAFPVAVVSLTSNKTVQHILVSAMALLLLVQTYWTIDPAILLTTESVDTGKKQIYKLCPPGDTRPGMTIGADYGPGHIVVCDLFTYNLEHSYYDSLIDEILTQVQPDEDTCFYQLDVMWYESHIYGNKYKIYWNTRTNNRTYDANDPDSIYLGSQSFDDNDPDSMYSINHWDVFTENILSGAWSFPDNFYLLVPARIDSTAARAELESRGYEMFEEIYAENIYGAMYAYGFSLQ